MNMVHELCCFAAQPRQNVLAAASRVGEAGHDIMIRVTDYETEQDRAFEVTSC